jgi:hypothetical protein
MSKGWIFRTQKGRRFGGKYSSERVNPKYKRGNSRISRTLARISSETEGDGLGASIMVREHIQSGGYVTPGGKFIHPKKVPPTKIELEKFSKPPPTEAQKKLGMVDQCPPVIRAKELLLSWQQHLEGRFKSTVWQSALEANGGKYAGYDHWKHVMIYQITYEWLLCFFSGRNAVFVELDFNYRTLRESRTYSTTSAREIVQAKDWKRIKWATMQRFPASG